MRSIATAEHIAAQITRPSRRIVLTSLVPTGVFLLFDGWLGLVAAMIAASVATLVLLLVRRQRGIGLGILLPLSFGFVMAKAVAGILTESEIVYFGAGLALTALLAVGVGATAFTKTPVASYLMPLVTPYRHLSSEHPTYRRVSAQITAAWAIAELGMTTGEAWHLTTASGSEFVATRSLVAWPVMGVVIFFLIFYVRFRLDRYEHALAASVPDLVDSRIHQPVDAGDGFSPHTDQVPELKGTTP